MRSRPSRVALLSLLGSLGMLGAVAGARSQAELAVVPSDVVLMEGGSFFRGASDRELREAYQLCLLRTRVGAGNELRCSEQLFELESPRRVITLGPYGIDRMEVSHARYRRCVAAGQCLPAGVSADDRDQFQYRSTVCARSTAIMS